YIRDLKKTTDKRIIFTGYVFGDGYKEFQSNAYFYVQATEVGGTHPALLEAMGYGNCVLANDVPEHREVLRKSGIYFNTENEEQDLAEKMQYLVDHPDDVKEHQKMAVARIEEAYTWDRITDSYEQLFLRMIGEDQNNGDE
ncbi:glycosyltransferase, partial [candidate division KSB1 bacterium]|nr:glycosyltransferase [candidate division KSB1 bacterium]